MNTGLVLILALGGVALMASQAKASTSDPIPPRPPKDPVSPPLPPKDGNTDTRSLPAELGRLVLGALQGLGVTTDGRVLGPVTEDGVRRATAVAGRLDAEGFPVLAELLREYARVAAGMLPPNPNTIPQPPGVPPELWKRINQTIRLESDPVKLRGVIAELQNFRPESEEINFAITILEAKAASIEALNATNDTLNKIDKVIPPGPGPTTPTNPVPPVIIPDPVTPTNPPITPKSKSQIAAEAMAIHLKAVQSKAGNVKAAKGKEDQSVVGRFQVAEGLLDRNGRADGKAGPGTMAALAKYVGNLPLVMYWPVSATKTKVFEYRNALETLASRAGDLGDLQRKAELQESARRERGQAGIVGPMPA